MTVGEDLMQKYPVGVTERIAKEIDDAIRQAVDEDRKAMVRVPVSLWLTLCFTVGLLSGLIGQYLLRS